MFDFGQSKGGVTEETSALWRRVRRLGPTVRCKPSWFQMTEVLCEQKFLVQVCSSRATYYSSKMGPKYPLHPTSFSGAALFSLLLLQTLDIFIPPAALPPAPIAQDRLGGVGFLRWVWAQPIAAQFLFSVFGAAVIYGSAILVARVIARLGLGRTYNEGASRLTWPVFGLSVGVFGWGLRRWAKQELGSQFTYQISNPQSLVTSGPFSYVVHPGYAGSILHVCGFCIVAVEPWNRVLGSGVAVLATSIVFGMLSLRIADEELLLESHFGQVWSAHIAERWHLFPFVW